MRATPWPTTPDGPHPFPEPARTRPETIAVRSFRAALAQLWAGRADGDEVAAMAVALGLDGPLDPELQPLETAPWWMDVSGLIRIATDADPSAGCEIPDRVLGPLADEVVDPATRRIAVALGAFIQGDGVDATPARRWRRNQPPPPRDARAAVVAIEQAPLAPWRIEAIERSTVRVSDMIHLDPASIPPGGAAGVRVVGTPFGPMQPGGTLVARLTPGPGGWLACCALALPAMPQTHRLRPWIRRLKWEARLDDVKRRPLSLRRLAARRGHVLTRLLLEQAWAA